MSQDTNLSVLARLGWSFLLHVVLPGVHGELHASLGGHPVVPHGRRPGAVLTSSEFDNSIKDVAMSIKPFLESVAC